MEIWDNKRGKMNKEKKTVALINEFIRKKINKLEKRVRDLEYELDWRTKEDAREIEKLRIVNETLQDEIYNLKKENK